MGPERWGRYVVLGEVGRGATGVVLRARGVARLDVFGPAA
jgi:hypothetical protein